MTTTGNRIFDDMAKLLTDATGLAEGVRREIANAFRAQAEHILRDLDYVSREEFEAVREMAIKARDDAEQLEERLAALEERLRDKDENAR